MEKFEPWSPDRAIPYECVLLARHTEWWYLLRLDRAGDQVLVDWPAQYMRPFLTSEQECAGALCQFQGVLVLDGPWSESPPEESGMYAITHKTGQPLHIGKVQKRGRGFSLFTQTDGEWCNNPKHRDAMSAVKNHPIKWCRLPDWEIA